MKLSALFSDYDGTLAHIETPRAESRIQPEVERQLRSVAGRIPFAVVTSKDCSFIVPRTDFATAWACVCGLDIHLSDGTHIERPSNEKIDKALQIVKQEAKDLSIEEKRGCTGDLLGFSVDWRNSGMPGKRLIRKIKSFKKLGLSVSSSPSNPFFDVFASRPDKGGAVRFLREELQVKGPLLYLGDTILDNPAFREADISVGISHGQALEELECQYIMPFELLANFLSALNRSDLDFTKAQRYVRRWS